MFWPTILLKIHLQKIILKNLSGTKHTALNVNTNDMEDYNTQFKMGELVDSLMLQSHRAAVERGRVRLKLPR